MQLPLKQLRPVPHGVTEVHSLQVPSSQYAVVQSRRKWQTLPTAQRGHEPPQSTSVSLPLMKPSVHVGPVGAGVVVGLLR